MGMAWLDKLHCVVSRRRTREGSVALEQPSTVLSAQHYLLQYTKGMYLLLPPPSLQKVHVHTDPPRSRRAPHPDFAIGATLFEDSSGVSSCRPC